MTENPLLKEWKTPFKAPPFPEFRPEHFRPAFDAALAEHDAEIAAIAENAEPPSFANTVDALELGGETLRRVSAVFFGLSGAHTNEGAGEDRARHRADPRQAPLGDLSERGAFSPRRRAQGAREQSSV